MIRARMRGVQIHAGGKDQSGSGVHSFQKAPQHFQPFAKSGGRVDLAVVASVVDDHYVHPGVAAHNLKKLSAGFGIEERCRNTDRRTFFGTDCNSLAISSSAASDSGWTSAFPLSK
jgi:hypothetical protein